MNPPSNSPSMPAMQPESGTPPIPTSNAPSFPSFPGAGSPSDTEQDYYYHPLATSSSIYDMDIDNISDIDPNNPVAVQDFLALIGPSDSSISSTLVEPHVEDGEEYDADDEDSELSMEGMDVEMECQAEGLWMIEEEEDHEMSQLEFMRCMAEGWTLDPDVDREAEHPGLRRRAGVASDSSLSNRSPRYAVPRAHLPHHYYQDSDEISSAEPASLTSTQDLSPMRGTVEYFGHFAGPSRYPEAAQFFVSDYNTGEFSNPFIAPGSGGDGMRRNSEPSPRTRVNDYGLIENWNFEIQGARVESPVSSLSDYSQFEDDGMPISPLSEDGVLGVDRRESSFLGIGICHSPMVFGPTFNRFPSLSSASSSSSTRLFSATDLVAQLTDLLFEAAAYSFFSRLDVEGLIADQAGDGYVFENHDILHDFWELENERPYRHWSPHAPERDCHCHYCIEYWMPDDEEEMYRPHDFDRRCSCPVCQSFRCQERVREMEREQEASDKELERMAERNRKRQHPEARSTALRGGKKTNNVHVLRREIRKVKEAQADEESEAPRESIRTFQGVEEREFADLRRFQDQTNGQEDVEKPEKTKRKKHCQRLFGWISRQFQEPESD